jgi:hypothetical protein
MIRLESKEDRTMAKLKPIISITLISILSIAISPSILQSASPQKDDHCCVPVLLAPIVVSGANIYTAWTNATTLGNDDPVFFTKSKMVEKHLQIQWLLVQQIKIQTHLL